MPIRAIMSPIPHPIAFMSEGGSASMIVFRIPANERTKNNTPATNVPAKAVCQLIPMPRTTVYAK